ncbi:sulfotransferase family protein [Altericroceibacterium spongiae]|uniref:Sulfotransferase family protein n=1 Tax=Altericroceibacterium spongiae TaxID=2320269 RepID=A0A420ELV5_9SPHN|nr:tetratricopeptide repeat-containing sulfotransferase family protein [Altericroceibacterium spongiae]RKF21702.1 sulfotransferase family protein [Altericroceibacterium spongiae]
MAATAESDDAHKDALDTARKQLKARQFAEAMATAERVLSASPDHVDALYIAAVAARYAGDYDKAQACLLHLQQAAPEYGRAVQEQGHLARDRGESETALAHYRRAVRLNPALQASWMAQAKLLDDKGQAVEAGHARKQAERIAQLPRELVAVTNWIYEGKILKAEKLCRYFLQQNPHHIEAMRLLAEIGSRLGVLDDAEFLLESAVTFAPGDTRLRLDYIEVLRKRQKFAQARDEAEKLYRTNPENPLFMSHLAIESMQTGDYDRAFALFDAVLQKLPGDPATLTSKGHALKTMGQQDKAVASYRAAFTARPDHGDAFYALANLKTYRFTDDELAAMEVQLRRPDLAFMDRVHMSFALAKAYEDRHDYERSFHHYEEGNRLKRAQTRYDADDMSAELQKQIDICTPALFAQHEGAGDPAPDPIFILGLPRAGSTLLEQILASHSQIDGTMELPDILALAHRLRGRKAGASRYPEVLHDVTDEQFAQMGRAYIENTRIHRQGAPFFIDKMPNNFRHIGLIHLILPNAKIIDARRAPMDCCFSGFKQLFAEGQEFTYGLHEVGRYYADYVRLMDHWDAVLPGKVLRVQHEDVLDNLEGQTRRMLDFIGVSFEENCLDFHRTERAVRTASSEQVRRPINRSGVGAWKPYEPWLGPLRDALAS